MPTLALRVDHYLRPQDRVASVEAIDSILLSPAFAALRRVGRKVGDRIDGHRPKAPTAVFPWFGDPGADAVVWDSGREGDLVASAEFSTGRRERDYDEPRPPLSSHVIVPLEPETWREVIDGFAKIAAALRADAGYIAVEPDYERAQRAALAMAPRKRDIRDYPRRAQERVAYFKHPERFVREIVLPEWGVIFGPKHLEKIDPSTLGVFAEVRSIGEQAKLALLTSDPAEALDEAFDATLDKARKALAPVMMDVSSMAV